MILSQREIEEIAAAVTKNFNEFFFGKEDDRVRMVRATPDWMFRLPVSRRTGVSAGLQRMRIPITLSRKMGLAGLSH